MNPSAAASSSRVATDTNPASSGPPQKKTKNNASSLYGHGTEAPACPTLFAPGTTTNPSYGVSLNNGTSSDYGNNVQQSTAYQNYYGFQHQTLPPTPGSSAKANGSFFYKTKLCTKFKIGACTFNERCHFAHGVEDLRKPPPLWESMSGGAAPADAMPPGGGSFTRTKTRPCKYFADGKCTYGDRCNFLHGNEESQRMQGTVPRQGYNGVSTHPNGGGMASNMQHTYSNQGFGAPYSYANSSTISLSLPFPNGVSVDYSAGAVGTVATPSMAPYASMPATTSTVNPYPDSQDSINRVSTNYNTGIGTGATSNPALSYTQLYETGNQGYQTASWVHNYAAGSYGNVENEAAIRQYPQEQVQHQQLYSSQNSQQSVMTHQGGHQTSYYSAP